MEIVLGILAVTVVLILTEIVRIDVVALLALLALFWAGALTPEQARSGFASNAVLAIVGVMIMGRGLSRSGITEQVAALILRVAGRGRRRIVSTVSMSVGVLSGFMQNIGAVALFLPVMRDISRREQYSISSLLMPMGFAALLGGNLSMVGSSSLIILNDLLREQGLPAFGLFHVLPIGGLLLSMGIVYFLVFGTTLFPRGVGGEETDSSQTHLLDVWGLADTLFVCRIPADSPLVGQSVAEADIGARFNVNLLKGIAPDGSVRDVRAGDPLQPGQRLRVQGRPGDVRRMVDEAGLTLEETTFRAAEEEAFLEVLIPAHSSVTGKTLRELGLREKHDTQVVLFFSEGEVVETGVADRPLRAGDTLILEGEEERLLYFDDSDDYISVTSLDAEPKHAERALPALGCFLGAIGLVLVLNVPISMGFLSGAVAMVLTGVLTIEDAYRAVEWNVIFLVAGLIPIGIAMDTSGAASVLANALVAVIEVLPAFWILFSLGCFMTVLALLMSNVAATVLMVVPVLELAGIGGLSAEVLALQVGLCAGNSFMLPTHQVNALLMTPGGYRVSDYLRAGSLLSLLYVVLCTTMLYLFFL
ncbi:MAG: SLC13 family permease [Salinivenus sp.]